MARSVPKSKQAGTMVRPTADANRELGLKLGSILCTGTEQLLKAHGIVLPPGKSSALAGELATLAAAIMNQVLVANGMPTLFPEPA